MEKVTLYKTAIGGLLLLNLILVSFLWLGRPGAKRGNLQSAVEGFEMTKSQNEEFLTSVDLHQTTIRQLEEEQRELVRSYFDQLKSDTVANFEQPPAALLNLEQRKIGRTYRHFLDLKKILNPEQLEYYPTFLDSALRMILDKSKKKPPPRRK